MRRDGGLVFHAGLPEEEDAPSCDGSCRAAEAEDSGQAPADGAVQDDVWHDETAAAPAKPRGPCPCRRKKDEPQGDPAPFREAFGDLVGMETVLGQIETEVQGARALGRPFPHTLFQGPPGTGKTTLARGIARVMGARMVEQTGPMLQDVPAALSALTSLEEGDVLFVDEIHAVPPAVREIFYEALAQRRVELRFRNGLHDKTVRMALPAFTLVAATTEGHGLSEALRSRFGLHARLDTYTEAALAALAHAQAEKKGLEVSEEATERLARAAGGTPRELLRLVDRIESYVAAEGRTAVDDDVGRAALARQGVDEHGLRPEDRIVLRALVSCGGPVGLVRLATLARVAREQILADVEPRLVRGGWMRVTPDGRVPGPRLVAAGPLAEAI